MTLVRVYCYFVVIWEMKTSNTVLLHAVCCFQKPRLNHLLTTEALIAQ